jgi:hypothetical protein
LLLSLFDFILWGKCLSSFEIIHEIIGPTNLENAITKPCRKDPTSNEINVCMPRHQDYSLILADSSDNSPHNPMLIQEGHEPIRFHAIEHASVYIVGTDAGCFNVIIVLFYFESEAFVDCKSCKFRSTVVRSFRHTYCTSKRTYRYHMTSVQSYHIWQELFYSVEMRNRIYLNCLLDHVLS